MRKTVVFSTVLLFSFLFIFLLALSAQETNETNKFLIHVGSRLTGTEEYTITKSAEGVRLTGKSQLEAGGQPMDFTEEQTLAPDLSLLRYRLDVSRATGVQSVEAWRDGQTIQMKASAGGQERTGTVPFDPNVIVLDNLITAHFQMVLNSIGGKPPGNSPWTFLVPQVLKTASGKVAMEGEEQGTLTGKPIVVKKYTIELPGVLEELWAEAGTNRLMRVSVPLQNVELVREGFALAPKAEPKKDAAFVERTLEFPSGSLKFPATLCLPANATGKKLPIVILVHGSGPQDRDETIGPNKPFRDLAQGLAAAGIATLRYDKRTFAFKSQLDLKTMTIEDETLADAVAALEFARTLPEADAKRVFVLGHSQGAMFAPAIAQRAQATGAIMMAAAERPLDQIIEEQITFQLKQAGQSEQEIATETDKLKKQFERVRSGEAGDGEIVFYAPVHYWRDLFSRDPLADLKKLQAPVLLLQGGKDIQVRKTDYDLAVQALGSKPPELSEVHWFPNLNHLFLPVEGDSTGAEYGRQGNIPSEVIQIISVWVNKQGAGK